MNEEVHVVGISAYANQTIVHPFGLLVVTVLGLCVLFLPRRWAVIPFLVLACFISSAQRVVVAGLDFNFLRIMVLFGAGRLLLKKEYFGFSWKLLDKVVVVWTASSILFLVIQEGTTSAFVNRLGFAFDVFGMYFVFRCLVRDWTDVSLISLGFIFLAIPVAYFFLVERSTGRNMFSVFGGVPEITVIREGRLRCQGAFAHPILAGCFWAAAMPLMASYWWKSAKGKILVAAGIAASLVIVFCCSSSTPVMGVVAAVVGGVMFYMRKWMKTVRWAVLLTLIALHAVMQAPVWHLIARVSAVGGSTSWHRYQLINETIKHFGDWWFCGCSGYTILSWGISKGDVTNQYVLEGVTGGFATMCLFFAIIVIAFGEVGKLWRLQVGGKYSLALSWALGVSLFAQCTMFIGVSYFGQIIVIWYLLLAMIGSLSVQKLVIINKRPAARKKHKNVNQYESQYISGLIS